MPEQPAVYRDPADSQGTAVFRWDRSSAAAHMCAFEAAQEEGQTQRAFAENRGVPRSTLQDWLTRKAGIKASPELVAFFESPAGVAFLKRVMVAAHVVMCLMGNCGIRLVCLFLELCGLEAFVACSYGAQQGVAARLLEQVRDYGAEQRRQLAGPMARKQITVCEDETFPASGLCLVAIEPVSGFALLEQYADKRDASTWNQALETATEDLNVEVVQSTSDEAAALLRHAQDQGAHHSPDLFHVQQEVSKAMTLPLLSLERQAGEAYAEADRQLEQQLAAQRAYEEGPRPPGRPPDFPERIRRARQRQEQARSRLDQVLAFQDRQSEAVRGISEKYHPYDLHTGESRTPEQLDEQLGALFDELDDVVREADLSQASRQRLDKARRVVPKMVATSTFYFDQIRQRIEALDLPEEHEELLDGVWIPVAYLECAAAKAKPERRDEILAVARGLLASGAERAARLSDEERGRLARVAKECADLFQRSSSCTEGRNGRLALSEHALRNVPPAKLEALTITHNYFARRPDGTTAAERFFGAAPADMFEWLYDRMVDPPRPAARRSRIPNSSLLSCA